MWEINFISKKPLEIRYNSQILKTNVLHLIYV